MNLFYTPDISGKTWILSEEESRHVVRVLRLKPNDLVYLTDGRGGIYTTHILVDHPKKCVLEIEGIQNDYGKREYFIQIAIAPTKNIDRFEWFLEKSTEIGIDVISPIICSRSERKQIKPERLMRVITAAMKQSLKAYHPILQEQQKFSDLINKELPPDRFIAHCGPGSKQLLKSVSQSGRSSIILIGPEGDFTTDETDQAISKGFIPVSLGDSRLRTETAGIAAAHTLSLINQKDV